MFTQANRNIEDHIEMLYIQAKSKIFPTVKKEIDKKITPALLESYLRKRGYTMNYVSGKTVMVKDFTCVYNRGKYLEIWNDTGLKGKSVFIKESLLTGLPITLDYMENI